MENESIQQVTAMMPEEKEKNPKRQAGARQAAQTRKANREKVLQELRSTKEALQREREVREPVIKRETKKREPVIKREPGKKPNYYIIIGVLGGIGVIRGLLYLNKKEKPPVKTHLNIRDLSSME